MSAWAVEIPYKVQYCCNWSCVYETPSSFQTQAALCLLSNSGLQTGSSMYSDFILKREIVYVFTMVIKFDIRKRFVSIERERFIVHRSVPKHNNT